ncbi:MAG: hypothetical protein EA378_08385 [Phycisphaerales bacterium]|nr:MAG: hypothetical protein EA378_08385 [Phycisphaerales bacterium]
MVGLIWFVQVVHYPLFAGVGSDCFCAYEAWHVRRTTLVVGPLMLGEAATALALAVFVVDGGLPGVLVWGGLGLLAACWLSTAFLQVPLHRRLERGWNEDAGRRLVATNWVRTIAWTARGVIALLLLHEAGGAA